MPVTKTSVTAHKSRLFEEFGGKKNLLKQNLLRRAAMLLAIMIFIASGAFAQKALKITRMRKVTWDTYSKVWSPWPTTWSTYEKGNEPVLTITKLDDSGYRFRVDMVVSSQNYSFEVTYSGFDDKNNWTKYIDQNKDEIAIVGSTMSKLSQYGWPDSTVQIYFWIYSGNFGLELE